VPEAPKAEAPRTRLVPRWLAALVLAALLGAAGWGSWLVLSNQLPGPG